MARVTASSARAEDPGTIGIPPIAVDEREGLREPTLA